MKLTKLGFARDQFKDTKWGWVHAGDLFYDRGEGQAWINFTAFHIGILQGRSFVEDGPYLDGDIMVGTQWIGHIMSSETKTGIWYTVNIQLIPCNVPSRMNIIRAEVIQ